MLVVHCILALVCCILVLQLFEMSTSLLMFGACTSCMAVDNLAWLANVHSAAHRFWELLGEDDAGTCGQDGKALAHNFQVPHQHRVSPIVHVGS